MFIRRLWTLFWKKTILIPLGIISWAILTWIGKCSHSIFDHRGRIVIHIAHCRCSMWRFLCLVCWILRGLSDSQHFSFRSRPFAWAFDQHGFFNLWSWWFPRLKLKRLHRRLFIRWIFLFHRGGLHASRINILIYLLFQIIDHFLRCLLIIIRVHLVKMLHNHLLVMRHLICKWLQPLVFILHRFLHLHMLSLKPLNTCIKKLDLLQLLFLFLEKLLEFLFPELLRVAWDIFFLILRRYDDLPVFNISMLKPRIGGWAILLLNNTVLKVVIPDLEIGLGCFNRLFSWTVPQRNLLWSLFRLLRPCRWLGLQFILLDDIAHVKFKFRILIIFYLFIVAYARSCLDIDGGVSGFRFWSLIIIIIEIVIRWILGHVLLLNGQIYIWLLDVAGVLDLSCVDGSQLLLWIFTAINYRHVELAPRSIGSFLIS